MATKATPAGPKSKASGKGKTTAVSSETSEAVTVLRNQAQTAFLAKDYESSAAAYAAAASALPDASISERVELSAKRLNCLLQLKKYKDVVKEATALLEKDAPHSTSIMRARSKAYEAQGLFKTALTDAQAINKSDAATDDTREMEKRLKDAIAGRTRPATAPPARPAAAAGKAPAPFQVTFKATLGSESKLIYASPTLSYLDLLDMVRSKFPASGPVALKYMDRDGDLVTISSRQDIEAALKDVVAAFQRQLQGAHAPKLLQQQGLPPLKIHVVPVASEAAVPRPPMAELQERKDMGPQQLPFEPEDWMVQFARLFTETTGLDPAAAQEHQQMANDKLQRAMSDTIHSDAAKPLFDEAADHFRDAVVTSYIQWGNVAIMKADRALHAMYKAAQDAGKADWAEGPGLAEVLAHFDYTEQKINRALEVNPRSWEAVGSLAQLEWERAKAKMGYVLLPLTVEQAEQGTAQATVNKQLTEVLTKVSAAKVAAVGPHIKKCNTIFEQALELAKEIHAVKLAHEKAREQQEAAAATAATSNGATPVPAASAEAEAAPVAEADEPISFSSPPANMMVMHGNILYDWSQVLAVTAAEPWRPLLDQAAAKFRGSGAPEADVRAALKNHLRCEELGLGPDPELEVSVPAAKETPKAAEAPKAKAVEAPKAVEVPKAVEEKDAPKGLPALERKKGAAKK